VAPSDPNFLYDQDRSLSPTPDTGRCKRLLHPDQIYRTSARTLTEDTVSESATAARGDRFDPSILARTHFTTGRTGSTAQCSGVPRRWAQPVLPARLRRNAAGSHTLGHAVSKDLLSWTEPPVANRGAGPDGV